ncbi:hypothetical protein NFI96_026479 [Prochilodus magdalenae]|nr:hypothetical protein NFI96_026479 [Prochilodus magdalenae]
MENNIEILDPPKNISVIVNSTDLEINWLPTKSINSLPHDCFVYEIKINDEVVPFNDRYSEVLRYTKRNLDLTRSYSIQIRTKAVFQCVINGLWSEWSESKVINQVEKPYHLNIYVILSIAFVLPMILLAILLVCKIQRLSEKLLPVIPSPSTKVKMLLENNDFSQVMPPKQCGCEAEEGTEILQVTG